MMENKQNFTYILQCGDGTLYTGWTNDLKKRMAAHTDGTGAKYTRGRGPLTLVYVEMFPTKQEAMSREVRIKRYSRADKLSLIREYKERTDHIMEHERR